MKKGGLSLASEKSLGEEAEKEVEKGVQLRAIIP